MSTDKNSFFVNAKSVIGMQCNGQSKKEKMINSGLKKNYTENWRLSSTNHTLNPDRTLSVTTWGSINATLFFVGLFHYNAGINVIYNFSF
jgi:hypothetical protein